MVERLKALQAALCALPAPFAGSACVGFDAAVDLLTRPVRRILADGAREHFGTIAEFGAYLESRQGQSCTVDVSTLVEKPGGNMVNLSAALGSLGVPVDCVGTLGRPDILPIYKERMPTLCTLHSVGHSGNCFALEFADGKVMLAQMDRANELRYATLVEQFGQSGLQKLFGEAALVGLVNWSEIIASTEIWQGILQDVFGVAEADKSRFVLFDFTDCSRHPEMRIREALALVPRFAAKRTAVVSLNHSEALQLCAALGKTAPESVPALALLLWQALGADMLVVHPNHCAIGVQAGQVFEAEGFFEKSPAISTGGGDNFNAGLALGLLSGMELDAALLLGNAVGGCYVRTGTSPTRAQLLAFIEEAMAKRKGEVQ